MDVNNISMLSFFFCLPSFYWIWDLLRIHSSSNHSEKWWKGGMGWFGSEHNFGPNSMACCLMLLLLPDDPDDDDDDDNGENDDNGCGGGYGVSDFSTSLCSIHGCFGDMRIMRD